MSEQDQQGSAAGAAAPVDSPMFTRAALARILPFITYVFFIFAQDMLERFGWTAAELRWMYGVKIAAVMAVLALFWRQYTELKFPDLKFPTLDPGAAALAVAVGVAVLVLWISLDAAWMVIGAPAGFDPRIAGQIDWPLVLVRIGGAALVVPLMEELFWRSFLMRWIVAADFQKVDPAQITVKSFIITSVLFGFEHNLWLAGIVAGVAYSALYMRHRTIWSPILAHAVTNGLLGVWVVSTANWTYW